jgi:hypothetical protein
MTRPLVVDLPHKLGAEEAKRRMQNGIGGLTDHLPAGAEVSSGWTGNRMNLSVTVMNKRVDASIEARDDLVRVEMLLPAALSFFAKPIEALLKSKGGKMLEDKRKKD